jgi:signal peptidase II
LSKANKPAKPDVAAAPAGDAASPLSWRFWLGLAVAAAVMLFDQASKWAVLTLIMNPPRVISLLPIFNLTLVYNPGVTFGLGNALGPYVLSAIAIVISVGLAFWLRQVDTRLLAVGIGGIIGGAIGNVIDRLRFGAVVDFLDFFIGKYHWPAFNVADSAIVVGVGLLVLDSFIAGRAKNA